MSRKEFYKLYYKITDREFSDHVIWTAEDREQAWRKGQSHTSKIARRILIVAQYLVFLAAIACFGIKNYRYGAMMIATCLLIYLRTDYSIVKVEVLYYLYHRKNTFSSLLRLSFLGRMDEFWSYVKPRAKNKISGFVLERKTKLRAQYCVVYRKQRIKTAIILRLNKIVIKTESGNHILTDRSLSLSELADQIASILISVQP